MEDAGSAGRKPEGEGASRALRDAGQVRTEVQRLFGAVTMSMMAAPRYRNLSIGELQQVVFNPLLRNRISVAQGKKETSSDGDIAGIAIWASVSAEVDGRIREQIREGVFPLRLQPEDWASGDIHWLIDVIAPSPVVVTSMLANFRQLVQGANLNIHPVVARQVDAETLEKIGARKGGAGD